MIPSSFLSFVLGDSTECDREVCNIVSGEDEDLKFLDVEPELQGNNNHVIAYLLISFIQNCSLYFFIQQWYTNILGAGHVGEGSSHHRAHEPEIQKASQVAIEGIKEPTALINRLTAVCLIMINSQRNNKI